MQNMGEGKQTLVNVCLKHNSNPSQINLLSVIIRTAGWCVGVCVVGCGGLFCIVDKCCISSEKSKTKERQCISDIQSLS